MRSILRDPGAEVIVGLLSFSASFLAIGLALIALKLVCYGYVSLGISALLFIVAGIAIFLLFRHFAKTRGYVQQMGEYLRQGYELRKKVISIGNKPLPSEQEDEVTQWENNVQQWLDHNLVDYASDFYLETIITTDSDLIYMNTSEEIASAATRLQNKLVNLREILRDVRK